jgi:hypothetical protein
MLVWPCSINYVYNSQLDALFVLTLPNWHISTCFGRINSPSSGDNLYMWQMVLLILLSGPLAVNYEVPCTTQIHLTSWWCTFDTPETCRSVSTVKLTWCNFFFIKNYGSLHVSSITCSSSEGSKQAALGLLRACYVSWLHQDQFNIDPGAANRHNTHAI